MSSYSIRATTEADIDDILGLVKDLAIYEKAGESAKATHELIKRNLFDEHFARCLLAVLPDGTAVGIALYFFNFSTWTGRPGLYLEDLFVKPEYRGQGIAKALFAELAKVAQEKNCARMDWSVLKWNQPSIDFYEKGLNATMMSEWVGMRLEEEGIEKLKGFGHQ